MNMEREAYVTKPFNGKVLLSRIENLLTTRRLLKGHFAGNEVEEVQASNADAQFVEKFKRLCVPSWPIPN